MKQVNKFNTNDSPGLQVHDAVPQSKASRGHEIPSEAMQGHDTVYALKHDQPLHENRVFLSDPGGVGKSHVIRLVHYETAKLLKPLSGHFEPDELPLLLTAFTGTAPFGMSFSCGPWSKKDYQPVTSKELSQLRSRLGKLKLLIIDVSMYRVSMVGADLLYHIHRRLQDITGKANPDSRFRRVSILAVRDLFHGRSP